MPLPSFPSLRRSRQQQGRRACLHLFICFPLFRSVRICFGRFRCPSCAHCNTVSDARFVGAAGVKVSFPSVSYHKQASYNESNETNGFHCFGHLVVCVFVCGTVCAHLVLSNCSLLPLLPTKYIFVPTGHDHRKLNRSVGFRSGDQRRGLLRSITEMSVGTMNRIVNRHSSRSSWSFFTWILMDLHFIATFKNIIFDCFRLGMLF